MKIHLIAVGNSSGKATLTAMITHVFSCSGLRSGYLTGSSFKESESPGDFPGDADIVVFEDVEYSQSSFSGSHDFLNLKPDIAILNGIGGEDGDESAVTENSREQLRLFIEKLPDNATLVFFDGDAEVKNMALNAGDRIKKIPYKIHGYFQNKKGFFGATHNRTIPLKITGEQNMQCLSAAREACLAAGVSEDGFYSAMSSFTGSSE